MYRLSVQFQGVELAAMMSESEDHIQALHECKQFAQIVVNTLRNEMGRKDITMDRLLREVRAIDSQLMLFDIRPFTVRPKLSGGKERRHADHL